MRSGPMRRRSSKVGHRRWAQPYLQCDEEVKHPGASCRILAARGSRAEGRAHRGCEIPDVLDCLPVRLIPPVRVNGRSVPEKS
eukprot:1802100-Rhodomonas_salina.1